jgi:hypothetical protein
MQSPRHQHYNSYKTFILFKLKYFIYGEWLSNSGAMMMKMVAHSIIYQHSVPL